MNPMPALFTLDRFVRAQNPIITQVLQEMGEGRKRSHWMWFIFPQAQGLGYSLTAQHYALTSVNEAASYLHHETLGARLIGCVALVLQVEGKTAHEIFGSPDDLKFRSSMTLFAAVPNAPTIFAEALAKYFDGVPDPRTMDILDRGARR